MNSFFVKRCKEIYSILIITIVILLYCVISDFFSIFSYIPRENLVNFVKVVNDPYQDIRGVMLIAPDQPKKLTVLQQDLGNIDPCHEDSEEVPIDQVRQRFDKEKCGKDIEFDVAKKDQVIVISTATRKKTKSKSDLSESKDDKEETYTFVTYPDHLIYTTCPSPSGGKCRRHDH